MFVQGRRQGGSWRRAGPGRRRGRRERSSTRRTPIECIVFFVSAESTAFVTWIPLFLFGVTCVPPNFFWRSRSRNDSRCCPALSSVALQGSVDSHWGFARRCSPFDLCQGLFGSIVSCFPQGFLGTYPPPEKKIRGVQKRGALRLINVLILIRK